MKKLIAGVAALGTLTGTVQAADTTPRVFKPAGSWTADYGDDYCRLSRNFSDGSATLALALERIEPGANMRMMLVGAELKTYRNADEIGWHFLPSDAERKSRATVSTTADGKRWYNLGEATLDPKAGFAFPPAKPPAAEAGPPSPPVYDRDAEQALGKGMTGFVLDGGLSEPVEVDTGNLGPPIGALQACADDLATTWGVDPAKTKTAAMPQDGPAGWLPTGTIAFTDFGKLGAGSNKVRLVVDATGKPTNCHVTSPTLDKSVNDRICATLMDKAKFTPAKDAAGQPIIGYWIGDPMFMLPPMKGFKPR